MRKSRRLVLSLLFLPFLLANSPAPGPFPVAAEYALSGTDPLLLKNTATDSYICTIAYLKDRTTYIDLEGFQGIHVEQGYLLPPGESLAIPLASLPGIEQDITEESFSVQAIAGEDLLFDFAEIETSFSLDNGTWNVHAEGTIANPSSERIFEQVGIYAKTEQGYFILPSYFRLGKKEEARFQDDWSVPETLKDAEFSAFAVFDNDYYSQRYGKPSLLEVLGYVLLAIVILIIAVPVLFFTIRAIIKGRQKKA